MLRVSVRGLPCQILHDALTMHRGRCCGKDACLGQFGSCATLGENFVAVGYVRVAYGALNVERQCSWAVVKNCFSPWRLHRCSSWVDGFMPVEIPQVQFLGEVVFMPVACRQFWGTTVQKTVEFPQLQCCHGGRCPCLCSSSTVVDVPVFAETVGLLLEVPQTQFFARAGGFSSFRAGVSTRADGDEGLGAHHTGDELN